MAVGDVFPPRNLPPEAVPWARAVEEAIEQRENEGQSQKERSNGQNRSTAATLSDLAEKYVQLQALYRAIPKPYVSNVMTTGFGLTSGWVTVATMTVPVPSGATAVSITSQGSGEFVATGLGDYLIYSRISIQGDEGPQFIPASSAAGVARSVVAPIHGRSFTVSPGGSILVEFQVFAVDYTLYPANAENFASIVTDAVFTG